MVVKTGEVLDRLGAAAALVAGIGQAAGSPSRKFDYLGSEFQPGELITGELVAASALYRLALARAIRLSDTNVAEAA